MNPENRKEILRLIDSAHATLEAFYPATAVSRGTPEWEEKRRLLLADLSLHLAQDALKGERINSDSLRNHLFAILKIGGEFFPEEGFVQAAGLLDHPQQ